MTKAAKRVRPAPRPRNISEAPEVAVLPVVVEGGVTGVRERVVASGIVVVALKFPSVKELAAVVISVTSLADNVSDFKAPLSTAVLRSVLAVLRTAGDPTRE